MARREQWRGHFHAVIKYLLEPARDDVEIRIAIPPLNVGERLHPKHQ
jgi:hypothetical protein